MSNLSFFYKFFVFKRIRHEIYQNLAIFEKTHFVHFADFVKSILWPETDFVKNNQKSSEDIVLEKRQKHGFFRVPKTAVFPGVCIRQKATHDLKSRFGGGPYFPTCPVSGFFTCVFKLNWFQFWGTPQPPSSGVGHVCNDDVHFFGWVSAPTVRKSRKKSLKKVPKMTQIRLFWLFLAGFGRPKTCF